MISMRVDWDGLADDPDELRRRLAGYTAAGVDHIVTSVRQTDLDSWMRSVEVLRSVFAAP